MNTVTVMNKELRSYFGSPVAYILIAAFLVLGGIFFASQVISQQQATMEGLFGPLPVILLLIAPILSMRLLSDEQRSGTIELLLTSPVSDAAVVIGKYLAALILYTVMLSLTLLFGVLLNFFGSPPWGVIIGSYLGALLLGGAFLAIGLFASSLTSNQAVAAFIALVITLVLWIVQNLDTLFPQLIRDFIDQLSIVAHYSDFRQGVVNAKDVIYYLSIIVIFVFMSIQSLESRRWR